IAFGWIHGVQNYKIAQSFIDNVSTGIAWEDMFEDGRHVFWKNNEIAGEAAILHAFQLYGKFPENMKVAILGRGNIARGAKKILDKLGANVQVYDQKTEKKFNEELENYEVIVNAILWDTTRKDHIIYREDLKRMKKGSMIIDISCDRNGAIETSIPTNLEEPIYYEEGILHYVVDHTPTIFFKSTTIAISNEVKKYIDDLIEENTNEILKKATIIKEGVIIDKRIKEFQKRK
ncbi:MAG: NAD(P)-dependent oxidoreductase, partial [Cetobacterium sp.]